MVFRPRWRNDCWRGAGHMTSESSPNNKQGSSNDMQLYFVRQQHHYCKYLNIPRPSLSAPAGLWMTSWRSHGRELNTPVELPFDPRAPKASCSSAAPSRRISDTQHGILFREQCMNMAVVFMDIKLYLHNTGVHPPQPSRYSCRESRHGTDLVEAAWKGEFKENRFTYCNNRAINVLIIKLWSVCLDLQSSCSFSTGYWKVLFRHRAKLPAISMSWSNASHCRFPRLI